MKIRTSGIVIVKRTRKCKLRVLLLQRPDGSFDIPKGRIEKGENPLDTALREVEEEIGVAINIFADVSCDIVTESGARYRFFLGTAPVKKVELTEHSAAFWVSLPVAIKLLKVYKPHLALAVQSLASKY